MKIITREFEGIARPDTFRVIPIGDIHLGAASCDEALLKKVINRIEKDEDALWIGMGDYCDFINRKDKRFSESQLAPWLRGEPDLVGAEYRMLQDLFNPIASKCLGLLEGNHETFIYDRYERHIYSDIVMGIKEQGGFKPKDNLALGYKGWLRLKFYRGEDLGAMTALDLSLHHGFTGGRLAGAKALNMQRWLWSHECDLALFGHSHNTATQTEAVEKLDREGNLQIHVRKGAYAGTFLRTDNEGGESTYAERKGYLPLPIDGVEVELRPGALDQKDRIRLIS